MDLSLLVSAAAGVVSFVATVFAYVQAQAARDAIEFAKIQSEAARDAVRISQEALAVAKQATTIAMAEHNVTKESYVRTACPIFELSVTAVSVVSAEERSYIRKKIRARRQLELRVCLRAPHESVSQVKIGDTGKFMGRTTLEPELITLEEGLVKDMPVDVVLILSEYRSLSDQQWTSSDSFDAALYLRCVDNFGKAWTSMVELRIREGHSKPALAAEYKPPPPATISGTTVSI